MSDGDDDGSDWLSRQFGSTDPVPPRTEEPVVTPPPISPPPVADAPAPNASGGFNWGLKPSRSVEQPEAVVPPVLEPPALVPPPASPPLVPPTVTTDAMPPTEPYVTEPAVTEPYVTEPTQPLSWDDFASTQQTTPLPKPAEQSTEAYTVQPWEPAATSPDLFEQRPHSPAEPTSAIDSLFGENQFQEYDELGVLQTIQALPSSDAVEPQPREPLSQTQKVLMGVAGGLIAILILIGLFFLGQHLGAAKAAAPVAKPTGASSTTPTPAGTGGPATPGVQSWTALQGGECIQPFSSAWALTFTVVPCANDHDAEMVFKGTLPDGTQSKYPTATAFQTELTPLCSAPTAINYAAAASVTDLQVSFSYPPNTASWIKGDRTYYCFVDRVSGGNLPGDLAVAKTASG